MFSAFLKRKGDWMYEYREKVRTTLEKRLLVPFLVEFSDFEQERGDPADQRQAVKATFETMKRMRSSKPRWRRSIAA